MPEWAHASTAHVGIGPIAHHRAARIAEKLGVSKAVVADAALRLVEPHDTGELELLLAEDRRLLERWREFK